MDASNDWQTLDNYETLKFIKDVRDDEFAPLFDGAQYDLLIRELPFLDGYAHYVLANKDMMPHFNLDYISNGEDHFYLDGSEHPLELLCNRGVLRLNERNVLDYLAFFSEVAFYPYRKVKFIIDPAKTPYSGASAMSHHFKTLKYATKTAVEWREEEQSFFITLPVLYNGETLKGHVQVQKCGEITILSPVSVPLMDRTRDHAPLHYSHPYKNDVLEQNIGILRHSESGRALIEASKARGDRIEVMSGVEHSIYVPKSGLGYVIVPQNIDTYSPYQLFDIIAVMKDLELRHSEHCRAHSDDDEDEYIEANASYNLEIIIEMCRIVSELEQSDFEDIPEKFRRDGYEGFYSAHKNGASKDEMYALLLQSIYGE